MAREPRPGDVSDKAIIELRPIAARLREEIDVDEESWQRVVTGADAGAHGRRADRRGGGRGAGDRAAGCRSRSTCASRPSSATGSSAPAAGARARYCATDARPSDEEFDGRPAAQDVPRGLRQQVRRADRGRRGGRAAHAGAARARRHLARRGGRGWEKSDPRSCVPPRSSRSCASDMGYYIRRLLGT